MADPAHDRDERSPVLSDLLTFLSVGFAAHLVDGAIGMAYGLTPIIPLSVGVPPAMANAGVHAAEVVTTGASARSHGRLCNGIRTLIPLAAGPRACRNLLLATLADRTVRGC